MPPPPFPPPSSPPPRKSRTWLYVTLSIGGLLALLVVGFVAYIFIDGAKRHQVDDAETVAEDYLTMSDDEAAAALTTAGFDGPDESCRYAFAQFVVESSQPVDDGAEVVVEVLGRDAKIVIHLVEEDGWKIDQVACHR